jgi:chitinase
VSRAPLLSLALAAIAVGGGVTASGADFAGSSPSPGNAFVTAADFNTVAVSMSDPGTPLRATVALTATASSERGIERVRFQSSPAGAGTWTDACEDTSAPYSCNWDTAGVADGSRDLRAVAVDQAGYQREALVAARTLDNTAPAVPTINNPGTPLAGSVAFNGTASDGGSGIAAWIVQYRTAGGGTWTDACSDTTAAYSCSWATTGVADDLYDVRSLARDAAGNETGSTVVASRRVDNVAPTVSLTDPGSPLSGTVTLNATASDGGGIASVLFERALAGSGSWTTICTDTTAPYSCSFNTTAVGEESYDLRARATDNGNRSSTSLVGARVVDNDTTPTGTDVQTPVTGATAGRLETGDQIRLTFSEPIAPASVLAGWTGGSQAIRVSVANNASNDRMDFLDSTGATRLNLVNTATDLQLGGNFVTANTQFNATMTRSGSNITVTLGSFISGTLATGSPGTMTWRPSAAALDLAGHATSTTMVTESGTPDRDF